MTYQVGVNIFGCNEALLSHVQVRVPLYRGRSGNTDKINRKARGTKTDLDEEIFPQR